MKITFLGATGTVTGSRFLVSHDSQDVLVDCGLFQGLKELRLRNREPFPIDPWKIRSLILTHAHLDHSGYTPLLVREGFDGPVYGSPGTRQLCSILLPDSGRIQEEDARYANKEGFSKHDPALPLYTEADANEALLRFEPVRFGALAAASKDISFRLEPAGHILGASLVRVESQDASILFSGDLGRSNDLLMNPPTPGLEADWVVVESTYGGREHPSENALDVLAEIITKTAARGGVVLIPAFAVGRAQALIFALELLKKRGRITDVPVYLDSPMATDVLQLYGGHVGEHRLSASQCAEMTSAATLVNSVAQSKALMTRSGPMIVISASGMATGGRVLHHIKAFAPDPRNTILFAGYQAEGTRGHAMAGGAKSVKVHGSHVAIEAEVIVLHHFSAHAGPEEILDWLRTLSRAPRGVFVVHGESDSSHALKKRIEDDLGWTAKVPDYLEVVDLTK